MSLQFLLFEVLGEKKINETSFIKLHEADSWHDFKYTDEEESDDLLSSILNRKFDLEEETCFDSYFWRITDEITAPLQEEHGFQIYRVHSYFKFKKKNYDKFNYFSDLLNSESITYRPNFKNDEKLLYELYWYSVNIFHSFNSAINSPALSFRVVLSGSVGLKNSEDSLMDEIYVARFVHKIDKEKNNYSYGVLVDSSKSYSNTTGWMIFQGICNNFSGAGSGEYRLIENLIKRIKEEFELIEIHMSEFEFRDFILRQSEKPQDSTGEFAKRLRKLIGKAKLKKAIKKLAVHFRNTDNTEALNQVTLLSSSLVDIKKSETLGVEFSENLRVGKAKLRHSILQIISDHIET